MLSHNIGSTGTRTVKISEMIEQTTLNSVRKILPDSAIVQACRACKYKYRSRLLTPVVIVLHMIMASIWPEESFNASWQTMWLNMVGKKNKINDPLRISFVASVRAIVSFSPALAFSPVTILPEIYNAMLDEIAANLVPWRPGRIEPRKLARDPKSYPNLKETRAEWRVNHAA